MLASGATRGAHVAFRGFEGRHTLIGAVVVLPGHISATAIDPGLSSALPAPVVTSGRAYIGRTADGWTAGGRAGRGTLDALGGAAGRGGEGTRLADVHSCGRILQALALALIAA